MPENVLKGAAGLALCFGIVWLALFVWSQTQTNRQAVLATAVEDLGILASLAAAEIGRDVGLDSPQATQLDRFVRSLPSASFSRGRRILLADTRGDVVASSPSMPNPPRSFTQLFGEAQPLTIFADRAGVMTVSLASGKTAIATVRAIPNGYVALVQTRADILAGLRSETLIQFAVGIAFVGAVGSLGALCLVQRRRVLDARGDRDRVRRRLDKSLGRGRCGLWDWDVAKGRIFWSDSMYELLGYERRDEDLSFGELDALVHPDDVDLYRLAEEVAASQLQQVDHQFRMRNARGEWIWLRARAELVEDECDQSPHLVGIAVDVTDERGRMAETTAADIRLRDAIEAISEAFVLWDADNRLVLCNSKFRNLHELPAGMVTAGTTYGEIMRAARPPVIEHQLSREHPEHPGERTLEAQLSDGRWLHINERRTRDGGFVSVGTDITDLKHHETKLLQSEGRLLQTVADLRQSREKLHLQAQQLAELAERHLEQKAEAEEANRAKTEFLAKMSHELRTPLNAIIGFAEIMRDEMFGARDGRYAEYSRDIHKSGHHLLSLIEDILDMSTIEAGRMDLAASPVAVAGAIKASLQAIRAQARSKSIEMRDCIAPGTIVPADERALQQVITNLVQNAVKFTPRGGTVDLRARRAVQGVNIFVADSGIGIPAAALARLGRPFEQVEPEFNRSHRGSGLGLAIARSLVELHGGTLRIRSQQGHGTVVLVHLPDPRGEVSTLAGPLSTTMALDLAS